MKFMFELLSDGTVERLCNKFKEKNYIYGFGGIAPLGQGLLPSQYVIKEHYRLGSSMAILSRSFHNIYKINNLCEINMLFENGLKGIRNFEAVCEKKLKENDVLFFEKSRKELKEFVEQISGK